jgi:hypothetical protein
MPFTVVCPSCSARIKAPDTAVGKTVKCPKCSNSMIISAPAPEPAPEVAEPVEVVESQEPEEVAPQHRQRPRRDDDDGESRPRKKKSNKGLIIGLSIGGVLLVSLCCCGGGAGMYYGGVFDGIAGNDKVTQASYRQLKVGMTMSEVQAIVGNGSKASTSDVHKAFLDIGGFGGGGAGDAGPKMIREQNAFEQGVAKGAVYRWKNGGITLLILFSGPPSSGGKAMYFFFREIKGNSSSTESNGTLS